MTALPPIRTVLQSGRKTAAADSVAVHLHAKLTEIGTLELWCSEVAGPKTWKLQFDVRAATRTDVAGHEGLGERGGIVDQTLLDACRSLIGSVCRPGTSPFSLPTHAFASARSKGTVPEPTVIKPESLVKRLAEATEMSRAAWPPSLLREMWEALMEVEAGRKQSPQHEARWLSLLGFALRPGYGMAVDDWRVAQTRRSARLARVQQSHLARRVVDSLAADRRWTARRTTASAGPAANRRDSQRPSRAGQRARTRIALRLARSGRAVATARLA